MSGFGHDDLPFPGIPLYNSNKILQSNSSNHTTSEEDSSNSASTQNYKNVNRGSVSPIGLPKKSPFSKVLNNQSLKKIEIV